MLKIKVTEKSGASIEYINDGEVLNRLHLMGHGLPERIVDDVEGSYNLEDVIEKINEIISPEIQEVMNDMGEIVQEFVPATIKKLVKLKAEYTVEITDITKELEQEQINQNSLKYLQDTDWYIIRELDSGIPCPIEIKEARQNARASIVK